MLEKTKERKKAVYLRKKGYTYSEILEQINVAKSTLSGWLRNVNLAKTQKQRITNKKIKARLKALKTIKEKRIKTTKRLVKSGIKEIGKLDKKDLFIIGIVLYWAEGSKQKNNNISQRVSFSNSDPRMIKIFLMWLKKYCKIREKEIVFSLYVHKDIPAQYLANIKKWWKETLKISKLKDIKICLKKNKRKKDLKINNYFGVFRIDVRKSTNLNRKINGWIEGIIKNYYN